MATGLAAARPARARVNRRRFILSWALVLGELLITILALDRGLYIYGSWLDRDPTSAVAPE
jgi:hypothetical protein